MTKDLVPQVAPEIEGSKHIKITPYAVEFDGSPSIEEWHKAVLGIQKVHGMMQFYLGDLMVYAESPVTGWGESKYSDLIEHTGYDYQTLRNFASISRRFVPQFREEVLSLRKDTSLSFGHFNIVAGLDDVPAKHFLEMVRDSRWTVEKLRNEVAKFKNGGVLPEKAERDVPIGYTSFKDVGKRLLKGYEPQDEQREYDDIAWLTEIRDWASGRLKELGVEG